MKEIKIENIDKNLYVSETIDAEDLCLYDVRKPPFDLYGFYNPLTEPEFKRMPDDIAVTCNPSVKELYKCTAGGRVRFSTDSPYVAIKCVMPRICHFSHMPLTGSSGFDIYIDSPDGMQSLYHRTFIPPYHMKDGYESKVTFDSPGTHYITINFPLYNEVSDLYIGVAEGSYVGGGAPYLDYDPILFYGSSITQGGCVSHPGNVYQSIISRELCIDHINLGFSSGAKGEEAMIHYMASLNISAFVADYDHNAPSADHLRVTHRALYDAVRAAHPDIPYIIMSRADFHQILPGWGDNNQSINRRRAIMETFHYARDNGDDNVYFIDGEGIYRGPRSDGCTVDGAHANDMGFSRMADAVECVLYRVLRDGKMPKRK